MKDITAKVFQRQRKSMVLTHVIFISVYPLDIYVPSMS